MAYIADISEAVRWRWALTSPRRDGLMLPVDEWRMVARRLWMEYPAHAGLAAAVAGRAEWHHSPRKGTFLVTPRSGV